MLDFVARVFRGWMNVLLWLILVGCAIGGAILGGMGFGFGYAVLGLLIGSLVGLITVVLSGGLIANFLDMVDNIETIKCHLSKTGSVPSGNSSGLDLSNVTPISPSVINSGDSWVCKKCNERNPNTASSCKGCGSYK